MNAGRGFRRLAFVAFCLWEVFAITVFANEAWPWWFDPWRIVAPMDQAIEQFIRANLLGLVLMIGVPLAGLVTYRVADWVRAGFSN